MAALKGLGHEMEFNFLTKINRFKLNKAPLLVF
jgi:hypothetical protein